nr:L10-interacting MYB domain-containing protein-like [Tanacetum cinerariifolium]
AWQTDYCIMKEEMHILRGWKSVPGMNSSEKEMEKGYYSAFTCFENDENVDGGKKEVDDMGACIEKLDKIGWAAQDPMYDTALLLFGQSADYRKLWLHLKPESYGNWVKSVGSNDDEIQALVQKQIDEYMILQKAILNSVLQFDNACTTKEDLRKTYEKCNDIPQESCALIDTFLKE